MKLSTFAQISVLFISTHLILCEKSSDDDVFENMVAETLAKADSKSKKTGFMSPIQHRKKRDYDEREEGKKFCSMAVCSDGTNNRPCQIGCLAQMRNYMHADSRDCRDYCNCFGGPAAIGSITRCPDGLVWDPNCRTGEMTSWNVWEQKKGGCCNWFHLAKDTINGTCKIQGGW